MLEPRITEENFLLLAMHHYDNCQCTTVQEFEEDLKRFTYLKKLFNRYIENNDLKDRLIINHLITLYNVFGVITTDFLFFKIDKKYWHVLATFLIFLKKMPDYLPEYNLRLSDVVLDINIIKKLRQL